MNPIICPTCGGHHIDALTPKEIRILKFRLGTPARDLRHVKKNLRELTQAVSLFLDEIDCLMKQPSTNERGRKIAHLSNALQFSNDLAKRFGLKE